MNASLKHLALAVLVVLFSIVSAPLIPPAVEVNVLALGENLGLVASDPELSLSIPKQSSKLSISSQSEVLFFDLHSEGPYTLRYLTLAVESEGLILPPKLSDWKIFEVEDGLVNYSSQVGYAEQGSEGFLRLRLYSSPAAGYLGEGEASFGLVAPLYKEGGVEASIRLTFPEFLNETLGWEFATGHHPEPWMDLAPDAILKTDLVQGLPSETVERN